MKTLNLSNIKQLPEIAEQFVSLIPVNSIVAFYGEMGSGKTTFIKEICNVLKVVDDPTSPTFAIVNEYNTNDRKKIYHFDFYRINKISEAFDIGFDEYIESGYYCFIEWPEKIEEILPDNVIKVKIEVLGEDKRLITIEI
jgi:tRNA threonylcarbamoyladenosine biosynthesis protein TsaE